MEKSEVHLATVFRFVISYEGKDVTGSIQKNEIILGRATPDAAPDIDLSADINVSRRHARIVFENGNYLIEDLGSKLGTLVNNVEIKGSGKRPLPPGSTVQIGNTILRAATADSLSGFIPLPASKPLETLVEKILPADWPSYDLLTASFAPVFQMQARLLELPLEFLSAANLHDLLKIILQRAIEFAPQANAGAVLLQNRGDDSFRLAAFVSEPIVTDTLARRALSKGEGFTWKTETQDPKALPTAGLCVPLIWKENKFGVIALSGLTTGFSQSYLPALTLLARYAAGALQKAL